MIGGPLVGALGIEVRSQMDRRHDPFAGEAAPPPVAAREVDLRLEGWAPRIGFVAAGACLESVSFAVGGPELAAFDPRVWVAGEDGAAVRLREHSRPRAHTVSHLPPTSAREERRQQAPR